MTAWFRSGLEDKKPRELSCPDARGIEILVQNFPPPSFTLSEATGGVLPSSPLQSITLSPTSHPRTRGRLGCTVLHWHGFWQGRMGLSSCRAVLVSLRRGPALCVTSEAPWAPSPHAFEDLEFGIWVRWGVGVMRDLQDCRHCCCYKPSVRWHSSFLWLQASFFSLLTLIPWDTRPLVLPCVLCAGEEGLFFRKGLRKAVVFEILRKPIQSS